MVQFCAVFGCSNRSNRDIVSFYRFPYAPERYKIDVKERTKLRCQKWLDALRRLDLDETKLKNARVCSEHFISGKPSSLDDINNPDWVPVLNLGYSGSTKDRTKAVDRYHRASAGQEKSVGHLLKVEELRQGRYGTPDEGDVIIDYVEEESDLSASSAVLETSQNGTPAEQLTQHCQPQWLPSAKRRKVLRPSSPTSSASSATSSSYQLVAASDRTAATAAERQADAVAVVATLEGGDVTTEQDLFYAAVKEEPVDDEESSLPAFDFARVKGEPVDCDEMPTRDDALLPALEEVSVDPPPVKTEPNNDPWGYLQLDTSDQIDPLLLPEELKQEPEAELQFAGTVTTQDQSVAGSSTAQGRKVDFCRVAQGQKVAGVACSECGEVCDTKALMKQHALSHSGEKVHECTECDFRTVRPSELARHKRSHTDEEPYACPECDYRTVRSSNLATHKMIHAGQKPFACAECDYRTALSGNLATHKMVHSGEKPYVCTECDYRSAHSTNLARHKRSHTREKNVRLH